MLPSWLASADECVGCFHRAAEAGEQADWPTWLPDEARRLLVGSGIDHPWVHQLRFAELAFAGTHAAITTPTASGKTLSYLMPLLAARYGSLGVEVDSHRSLLTRQRHTALYLAPTKALAHDQYRSVTALGDRQWPITTLDGDSDPQERRFAREYADYILTNPDMLHYSVLPAHSRWAAFLGNLRYVIVDEAHRYRGTFGAHVSAVLRRLRRVCASYGSHPTMLLASATSPNAAIFGGELIGEDDVAVVSENTAPRPRLDIALWQPTGAATTDAARLLARLVDDGLQTISFVASRNLAELIALRAQEISTSGRTIGSYRAGYLASDRRDIEADLQTGALSGVSATNALELGVDISGMDAVVVNGFPGTVSAMWQQFGRAGRSGRDGIAVLVAGDDPLDGYLFSHPELLSSGALEHQVLHTANPYVLGPHLAAAAQEIPLQDSDTRWFGQGMTALADHLGGQGVLRKRPGGWYWTRQDRAVDFISLRSAGGRMIDVIEQDTGKVLGSLDEAAADRTLHDGAVYLHLGEQYLVTSYLPDEGQAMVVAKRMRYFTQPLTTLDIAILSCRDTVQLGYAKLYRGEVTLTSQVTGFLRRDDETHAVWDQTPLELPSRELRTQAVWWTIPDQVLAAADLPRTQTGAAAHAMEHCAIGLLPAFAPCDRWDIGGVSTAMHPDTGEATVFVYDGLPGGAGFAYLGYELADTWLAATLERLSSCACDSGCPACVVSPKCGNANQFLDRYGARNLLGVLLGGGNQSGRCVDGHLPPQDPLHNEHSPEGAALDTSTRCAQRGTPSNQKDRDLPGSDSPPPTASNQA